MVLFLCKCYLKQRSYMVQFFLIANYIVEAKEILFKIKL